MFSEKLNALMSHIGATAANLASLAGFDRTNISRLKSGRRVPGADSSTAAKLINGIYLFSDNKNDLKTLCSLTGADENDTADAIRLSVKNYLFDGQEKPGVKTLGAAAARNDSPARSGSNTFSDHLNISMELSGLSNIRLSRLVHSDPSLISRYRNGVRTPASNPELSLNISNVLYDRMIKNGREKELSAIIGVPLSEMDEEVFFSWLFSREDESEANFLAAENILASFDSFTSDKAPELPAVEAIISEAETQNDSISYGISGLRSCVLRFLTTAVQTGADKLYLYSDEDQSWLTADPVFLSKWAALMIACIKGGTRICIIHNADRSLDEMNDAIKSWLPLYMSGMIESYSCKKQRNSRFAHTFFLMPQTACIRSFGVASAVSDHIYHYYTEPEILDICMTEYSALLEASTPLMKPLPATEYPEASDIIVIRNSLSVATMSRELAESFGSPELMNIWERAHSALLDKLKTDRVCECIPLVKAGRAGEGAAAPALTAAGLCRLSYTLEQYSMHIGCIADLLDKYSNYRFYPIPEPPFPNIDLFISDNMTKITPTIRPGLSFSFVHPAMCLAFKSFAEALTDKWKTDRNTLRRLLLEKLRDYH